MDTCLSNAIVVFLGMVMLMTVFKPAFMYDGEKMRAFGTGPEETLFAFGPVTVTAGLLTYAICLYCEVIGK